MSRWAYFVDSLAPLRVPEGWVPAPTTQEYLHGGEVPGDCFRCCVAAVLGHERADVPHFARYSPDGDGNDPDGLWWWSALGYLAACGLWLRTHDIPGTDKENQCEVTEAIAIINQPGPYLLVGKSPRGDWNHVVVVHDGRIAWDPHPDRRGLDSAYAWEQFLTLPENLPAPLVSGS